MERNREARRGMNGAAAAGMLRRRQRNGSFRDSPEEDGGMEMQAMGRLRDRGIKKDRDRDRSGRSKRRRGDRDRDRAIHASNREEGEDTSEDSEDEEDEEIDEEASLAPRLPPPPSPLITTGPPASLSQNHHRKSFPMTAKASRPPVMWKPADEMIGVSVPRKARSSSVKRTQEFSVAGGEAVYCRVSTSPARPSTSSATQISPTSSASAKKKMKVMTGSKNRPPKVSKSPVSEDIEIEVAEVLYGLTRQFQSSPPKSETREANGSSNEMKSSRISSPISSSLQQGALQSLALAPLKLSSNSMPIPAMAPKRKKPRHIRPEDIRPANPPNVQSVSSISASSATKIEPGKPQGGSPEKITVSLTTVVDSNDQSGYGVSQAVTATVADVPADSMKMEIGVTPDLKISGGVSDCQDQMENKNETSLPPKEILPLTLDVKMDEPSVKKDDPANDGSQKGKFSIDLMVTTLGKSSPERESSSNYVSGDHKAQDIAIQQASKEEFGNREVKTEESTKLEAEETLSQARKVESSMPKVLDVKKRTTEELLDAKKQIAEERALDLQLNFEKQEKDGLGCNEQQVGKQPLAGAKMELGTANCEQSASLTLPIPVAGWPGRPGTFPQFGYVGQVPCLPAVPADGSARSSSMQRPTFPSAQARPKRCATHCYIAHNIHYHQQLSRMNPFWPVTAGTAPLYGGKHYEPNAAKHYNLNAAPPSGSSVLGSSLQPNIALRNLGPSEEKAGQSPAAYLAHSTKEKSSSSNIFTESAQRKQPVIQQGPQDSAANMLQGPTFIFPINQQQAAAAAAGAARSAASKAPPGAGNAVTSSSSPSSVVGNTGASGQPATMSFNYPVLSPNEAQYMAILQNSGYPFPIPAHVGAPPAYKGGCAPQPVPFFNGPFYSSQMLHPQMQQQPAAPHQQPSNSHAQQGHQNTSTSSGSSSSQKPRRHSQLTPRGGSSGNVGTPQGFPATKEHQQHLPRQLETGNEENPSTADSIASQAQKNMYGHNFAMAIHPQNFALLSPAAAAAALGSGAAAALGGGTGNRNEKQQPPPHNQPPKADLTTSQAFALSLASFTGAGGALPQGLGFSSMAQNHAIFQSLPEASKQGYHINAATMQASQYRKPYQQIAEDGKSKRDSMNTSTGEEERKLKATSKTMGSIPQHSINFSQLDKDRPSSVILGNTVVDSSSKTLNLIQPPANGSRLSNRPASAAPTTSSSVSAPTNSQLQQQQQQHQHMIQLQKQQQQQQLQLQQQQQQQQLQLQHQFANRSTKSSTNTNSAAMYSDRLPASSNMSKYNQPLTGFPQAFIQSSGTTQSSQWKTSTRASTPAPTASSTSSPKNQPPQQQGRTLQQPILMPTHQTQISFGMNSSKAAVPAGQQHLPGGGSSPSFTSTSSAAVGSPQGSASKSFDGSSPRASSSAKQSASQANLVPIQQQQQPVKNSPTSNSTLKSSPLSNSNASSILGHPPATQNASAKQQQQQPQQLHKQPLPQPQFFFSNAYPQAQASQSNGSPAAGYYHQRRPSDQQLQQHPSQQATASLPTGMFSLCPSSMTLAGVTMANTDPAKAAASANNMKSMAVPGMLQHPAQIQSASHPFMPAAAAFPYIHTMPAVSVKPAEQKPAAGNDSLHASWQPEKR